MTRGSSKAKTFLSDACEWEWNFCILGQWCPNFLSYSAADEIQPKLFYNQRLRLCSHNMPDRFSCRHDKLPSKVWTPIRYVTLHYKDSELCGSITEFEPKLRLLLCKQRPYPVWFSFRRIKDQTVSSPEQKERHSPTQRWASYLSQWRLICHRIKLLHLSLCSKHNDKLKCEEIIFLNNILVYLLVTVATFEISLTQALLCPLKDG